MSTLDRQLARFVSRYPEFKLAILFGSQATGNVTGDSDIDLALLSDAPISSGMKLQLVEQIGARFGRPVDIVDLFFAAEPILGQVFKGKRLLGDDATYARLLTRHLINTADFVPLQQRILTERRNAWIK
ncbi:MAG: nucleotidyltransferase domain-containing protein [Gammaproteobacteria bacterium]|nr:nucleotidyltransferase domain-containing protein [Gammaproteobacteria bacterium]